MLEGLKPIAWVGGSLDEVREFPAPVKREVGRELMRVQSGLMPTDAKPMPTVGAGVHEVRVRTGREHRVFFVAKFSEAVYVLHAFEKKSQRTARADLDLGRARYLDLLTHRRKQGR